MSITTITHTEQAQAAALTDAHYELCAYSLRMDNDETTIARLRGRLAVCTDIMSSAAAVLGSIEPENAAESEALDTLLDQIKTACLAIWTDPAPGAGITQNLAAAAPDLLTVLQEVQEAAAYWSEYEVPLGMADRINAAVAKATGGKA